VVLTIAARGEGVEGLREALDRHHDWLVGTGALEERRRARLVQRTREVVERAARRWLWEETRAEALILERLDDVADGRLSPYDVAGEVLDGLKQGERI
jgi:LAO/AO transport system kinase